MILRLLDIDRRAALLPRHRKLTFPDGASRVVSAPVVVWRWHDLLIAAPYGPTPANILKKALRASTLKRLDLGQAFSRVIAAHVRWYEERGADLTDFDLDTIIQAKAIVARSRNP